jgi:hypothetical protein
MPEQIYITLVQEESAQQLSVNLSTDTIPIPQISVVQEINNLTIDLLQTVQEISVQLGSGVSEAKFDSLYSTIENAINSSNAYTDTQIGIVENLITVVNSSIDSLQSNISFLSQDLRDYTNEETQDLKEDLENQLDSVNSSISAIQSLLDAIQEDYRTYSNEKAGQVFTNLTQEINSLKSRVTALESFYSTAATRDFVDQKITDLNSSISSQFSSINSDISALQQFASTIKDEIIQEIIDRINAYALKVTQEISDALSSSGFATLAQLNAINDSLNQAVAQFFANAKTYTDEELLQLSINVSSIINQEVGDLDTKFTDITDSLSGSINSVLTEFDEFEGSFTSYTGRQIYAQDDQPTGNFTKGDLWVDTNSNQDPRSRDWFEWDGTSWVSVQPFEQALINAVQVNADMITSGAITSDKLAVGLSDTIAAALQEGQPYNQVSITTDNGILVNAVEVEDQQETLLRIGSSGNTNSGASFTGISIESRVATDVDGTIEYPWETKFFVNDTGDIYLKGNIRMEDGSILTGNLNEGVFIDPKFGLTVLGQSTRISLISSGQALIPGLSQDAEENANVADEDKFFDYSGILIERYDNVPVKSVTLSGEISEEVDAVEPRWTPSLYADALGNVFMRGTLQAGSVFVGSYTKGVYLDEDLGVLVQGPNARVLLNPAGEANTTVSQTFDEQTQEWVQDLVEYNTFAIQKGTNKEQLGNISFNNQSRFVTGVGTEFTTLSVGEPIYVVDQDDLGEDYELSVGVIEYIDSDTSLLLKSFPTKSLSTKAYYTKDWSMNFYVNSSGDVFAKGNLQLTDGSILVGDATEKAVFIDQEYGLVVKGTASTIILNSSGTTIDGVDFSGISILSNKNVSKEGVYKFTTDVTTIVNFSAVSIPVNQSLLAGDYLVSLEYYIPESSDEIGEIEIIIYPDPNKFSRYNLQAQSGSWVNRSFTITTQDNDTNQSISLVLEIRNKSGGTVFEKHNSIYFNYITIGDPSNSNELIYNEQFTAGENFIEYNGSGSFLSSFSEADEISTSFYADSQGNLNLSGNIFASGGSIGGVNIYDTSLSVGDGTYNNANTGFYLDSLGNLSLKDKLVWNSEDNTLTIKGSIIQDSDIPVFKGDWDSNSVTYYKSDLVNYSNSIYICLVQNVSNVNDTPDVDTTNWALYLESGVAGPEGAAARSVKLTFDSQVIRYDSGIGNPTSITFTATPRNFSGAATFKFYIDGTQSGIQTSQNTFEISGNNLPSVNNTKTIKVEAYEDNVLVASDTVTVYGLRNGGDAITVIVSNENHTVPLNVTNNNEPDYTGSGTTVTVFEGSDLMTYDGNLGNNSTWKITSTPSGITLGSESISNNIVTYADHSAMTSSLATVAFTINLKTKDGQEREIVKQQTISKLGEGVPGLDGDSGIIVAAYKRSATTPTDTPTENVTVSLQTGKITLPANGEFGNSWQQTIPDGTDTVYVIYATAYGSGDTDVIAPSEWTPPSKYVEDGRSKATVYIYQRTDTNTAPSKPIGNTTYTFSTDAISFENANGWLAEIPNISEDGLNHYLWISHATAVSTSGTDIISSTEWSEPALLSSKGDKGDKGDTGDPGTPRYVTIDGGQKVTYNSNQALVGPNSILFTVSQYGFIGTPSYQFYEDDSIKETNTTGIYTYTPPPTLPTSTSLTVKVVATDSHDNSTYDDSITIAHLKDGDSSINVVLSNESHSLTRSNTGTVFYVGSGTTIQVFRGTTKLDGIISGNPTASQYTVSHSATNIVAGAKSVDNNNIVYGDARSLTTGANQASIEFTITVGGESSTIVKTQTFSVSDQGSDGAGGSAGAPGPGVVYTGPYNPEKDYFSTEVRKDIVKYLNNYYISSQSVDYKGDWNLSTNYIKYDVVSYNSAYYYSLSDSNAGVTPSNSAPWSILKNPGETGSFWNTFGATFDSVATDILLAKDATILKGLVMGQEGAAGGFIRSANYNSIGDIDGVGYYFNYDGDLEIGSPDNKLSFVNGDLTIDGGTLKSKNYSEVSLTTFTTNFTNGWEKNFYFQPGYKSAQGNDVVTNNIVGILPAEAGSTSKVLKAKIPGTQPGTDDELNRDGINFLFYFADNGFEEADYAEFEYQLKFDIGWSAHTHDDGKLPGFASTNRFVSGATGWGGRKTTGDNGWSARGLFIDENSTVDITDGDGKTVEIGNYVYHIDQPETYGQNFQWNLPSGPTRFNLNQWYRIKQTIKMNDPGLSNGELNCYVDGTLVFSKTNFKFRETSNIGIQSVWFNVYLGGAGTSRPTTDQFFYIREAKITSTPKFSIQGTEIDLSTGAIKSPNFSVDSAGNSYLSGDAYFSGRVSAGSLIIGENVYQTKNGIFINENNYFYDTGDFKIGSQYKYVFSDTNGYNIRIQSVDELDNNKGFLIDSRTLSSNKARIAFESELPNGPGDSGVNNGTGFYADDLGGVRVGKHGGNSIKFDGTDLNIVSPTVRISSNYSFPSISQTIDTYNPLEKSVLVDKLAQSIVASDTIIESPYGSVSQNISAGETIVEVKYRYTNVGGKWVKLKFDFLAQGVSPTTYSASYIISTSFFELRNDNRPLNDVTITQSIDTGFNYIPPGQDVFLNFKVIAPINSGISAADIIESIKAYNIALEYIDDSTVYTDISNDGFRSYMAGGRKKIEFSNSLATANLDYLSIGDWSLSVNPSTLNLELKYLTTLVETFQRP